MANIYEGMNVYQKLAKARLQFLNQNVTQSGKNMHLEFKYYELADIVPPAIRIFARVGLTTNLDFSDENGAVMRVYNCDNPAEAPIEFRVPYREVKPIISNQGKEVTNPMQALGSSITYLRRYLWLTVLDITVPDEIEPTLTDDTDDEDNTEFAEEKEAASKPKKESKKKAPATTQEREEAKKELVQADVMASAEQLTELKRLCKELLDKDESQEEFVQKIALKTKGLTEIKASACTELCKSLTDILAQYQEG